MNAVLNNPYYLISNIVFELVKIRSFMFSKHLFFSFEVFSRCF